MAGFVIDKVDFGNVAVAGQTFSFWYKLWSDPESSYVLIDTGVVADADGNITASPLPTVTGLIAGELYYLRAANECNSPLSFFVISVNL